MDDGCIIDFPPPPLSSPDPPSQGSGGIPLARKLCYAMGGVPNQLTAVAIGVSLQIFLLDVVQVTLARL